MPNIHALLVVLITSLVIRASHATSTILGQQQNGMIIAVDMVMLVLSCKDDLERYRLSIMYGHPGAACMTVSPMASVCHLMHIHT